MDVIRTKIAWSWFYFWEFGLTQRTELLAELNTEPRHKASTNSGINQS